MLDEMMTLADFETPFPDVDMEDPASLIPASTKSKTWQEIEKYKQVEHQKNIQQRYFYSNQPKSTANVQHQYPTRSKNSANEAKTTPEGK